LKHIQTFQPITATIWYCKHFVVTGVVVVTVVVVVGVVVDDVVVVSA